MASGDIPFIKRRHTNLVELFMKVKGEEAKASEEERRQFDVLFGPDIHCLDWKCYRSNQCPIYDMYLVQSPVNPDDFTTNRLSTLKAQLLFQIHAYMYVDMAQKFGNLAEILFNPDDERIQPIDSARTSAFRSQLIHPIFGSTQGFWEAFLDTYHEVSGRIYRWPSSEPDVNYWQARKEFQAAGDATAVKLADMVILLNGGLSMLGKKASNAMINAHLWQPHY